MAWHVKVALLLKSLLLCVQTAAVPVPAQPTIADSVSKFHECRRKKLAQGKAHEIWQCSKAVFW